MGSVNKAVLLKLKLRAMRLGVWFRCLPRIDRALVEATLRVNVDIRSLILVKSLRAIAGKIEGLLEGKLQRATREFGFSQARKLSGVAQGWGYAAARAWSLDLGFARFLAAMSLSARGWFGV